MIETYFHDQAKICADLVSPFTAEVLTGVAKILNADNPVSLAIKNWSGDPAPFADSVPLRVAGALHALVLTNADPGLVAAYPPGGSGELDDAIETVFKTHAEFILGWMDSPPQTNEIRRSAVLIPMAHWIANETGCALSVSEIGASAGLNLLFPHFRLDVGPGYGPQNTPVTLRPEWSGSYPAQADLRITDVKGCDLAPMDMQNPDDVLRLSSYLWPDQMDRIERTQIAIKMGPQQVEKADALAWLPERLNTVEPGVCRFIYSTIAWFYLPIPAQAKGQAMICDAGHHATEQSPLAWFQMEPDNSGNPGAALTLRLWPGDHTLNVGRADFHGRWVDWQLDDIRI